MSMEPRAVIAAPIHWTSPLQVGTHHIARTLASAGWQVAYLSDPLTPLHVARLTRPDVRERWRLHQSGGFVDGRVTAWLPMTMLSPRAPVAIQASGFAARWLVRSGRSLNRWLKQHGFIEPDLLWIDSVIWDRLPELIGARRSVLRIADSGSGFPRHLAAFDVAERRLAAKVDLVVYTAESLRDHVASLGAPRFQQMPNGVDLARFKVATEEPPDLTPISRPRAIYVGAIDDWFDFDLVAEAAVQLSSVSFVLIGPDHTARRRLPRLANIHLMGTRHSATIPAYLMNADVGLIPFDVQRHPALVHSIQPLKLYEYLASGLPVVAARWRELERLRTPALLYDSPEEAIAAISRAIRNPPPPEVGRALVEAADWPARLDPVLRTLDLPGLVPSTP